jgi:hypothetical protein
MNQAQLFEPAKPEARAGCSPASKINYRGHLIPASYRETVGMRIESWPTLVWLMDEILEALQGGPILSSELHQHVSGPVAPGVIAKHRHLLEELGLVRTVYPGGSLTMYSGGCIQATVELVEV